MRAEQSGWFIRRWWWLVLGSCLAAAALSVSVPIRSSETFSAHGSFIVRPAVTDDSNLVRATATLIGNPEIMSTFAEVARSGLVVERALGSVEGAERDGSDIEATSAVVPDTNVVEIGARSDDPDLARQMAVALGEEAVAHVAELDGLYQLTAVEPPAAAVRITDRTAIYVAVAAVLAGLAVGLGLALAAEHRYPTPPSRRRPRAIVDPQSGAFSRRYLRIRFREEMSRSRAGEHAFSLGVLRVVRAGRHNGDREDDEPAPLRDADLVAVTNSIEPTLRDHDIFAYLGHGRFAALLPNVARVDADALVQEWRKSATRSLLRDRADRAVVVTVAACECDAAGCIGDRDAEIVAGEL